MKDSAAHCKAVGTETMYVALNARMIDEREMIWKETVMA
jgi:hypothetical protein